MAASDSVAIDGVRVRRFEAGDVPAMAAMLRRSVWVDMLARARRVLARPDDGSRNAPFFAAIAAVGAAGTLVAREMVVVVLTRACPGILGAAAPAGATGCPVLAIASFAGAALRSAVAPPRALAAVAGAAAAVAATRRWLPVLVLHAYFSAPIRRTAAAASVFRAPHAMFFVAEEVATGSAAAGASRNGSGRKGRLVGMLGVQPSGWSGAAQNKETGFHPTADAEIVRVYVDPAG